ncbi:hypothetical protein LTR04_006172 [Oleoguttula sp. CCFEE 6159]|nr:hypothetical protein LTR04_006172 [Oleoguttula sp. CCFEE 6159]
MIAQDRVTKQLNDFFRNGRAEVGLEVGTDPGLNPEHYVQLPESLKKAWAYRKLEANTTQFTQTSFTKILEILSVDGRAPFYPSPGLQSPSNNMNQQQSVKLPSGKNSFASVTDWTLELLSQIEIVVSQPEETTNDFTRSKKKAARYWATDAVFKFESYDYHKPRSS